MLRPRHAYRLPKKRICSMNYRAFLVTLLLIHPTPTSSVATPNTPTREPLITSSQVMNICIQASLYSFIFVLVAMLLQKGPAFFKKSTLSSTDKNIPVTWAGPLPQELDRLLEAQNNGAVFRKFNIEPPRGYLLYGPPGTGKTMLATYIAQTLDVPLFKETSGSFLGIYQGTGTTHLNEILSSARALPDHPTKPFKAVIFIDEFDGIASRESSFNREELRLAEHLLAAINAPENNGILFLGATNLVESVDKAFIRSGRLTPVQLTLPAAGFRKALFEHYATKHHIALENVSSIFLAEETAGFSCADINEVVQEALYMHLKKPAIVPETCLMQALQNRKRIFSAQSNQ